MKVKQMAECDAELAAVLFSRQEKIAKDDQPIREADAIRKRSVLTYTGIPCKQARPWKVTITMHCSYKFQSESQCEKVLVEMRRAFLILVNCDLIIVRLSLCLKFLLKGYANETENKSCGQDIL